MAYNICMTTAEAAEQLNVSRRTIQKHLQEIGAQKQGRDYWITSDLIVELRNRIHDGVGNPNWKRGRGSYGKNT